MYVNGLYVCLFYVRMVIMSRREALVSFYRSAGSILLTWVF